MKIAVIIIAALLIMSSPEAGAQTASLGARKRDEQASKLPEFAPRESARPKGNAIYERHSLISLPRPTPRVYRVNDLLTIVVRQSLQWEAESDLKTQRKWDIKSELEAFPKFTQGGVGASTFRRGMPNVDYKFDTKLDNKGDASREDRLTTRLTAKIIDVKPNGQLVIEGRGNVVHDEESSEITITGVCRKEDVTPDNTVLSTQIADLSVEVQNRGAVRDASTRGWISKLLDKLRPI